MPDRIWTTITTTTPSDTCQWCRKGRKRYIETVHSHNKRITFLTHSTGGKIIPCEDQRHATI